MSVLANVGADWGNVSLSPREIEDRDAEAMTGVPANLAKRVNLNTSGITPLAFKVLILPDPVEEVTKGGIIIPIEKATKDEYATTRGTIVAVSGSAFSHVTDEEWGDDKPKPGDHVVYTRYAGFRCEGDDGKDYLIVKGEDIHAKF